MLFEGTDVGSALVNKLGLGLGLGELVGDWLGTGPVGKKLGPGLGIGESVGPSEG